MKHVLVLGAGLVARPLVRYLLDQGNIRLTIADIVITKAEKMIDGHPHGQAINLDVNDQNALKRTVRQADIVVSLLPWTFHIKVARMCLQQNKNLVTASYVKPEMKALDREVKAKNLIFLNEIGVDPGIDHMAAMKIIDEVKSKGGKVLSFHSYCGGLPALDSNNNPFGYKFSWSPSGVMLAALNDGRYLQDGKEVYIPSEQLFEHYWLVDIPGAGTFEAYVNRDALPYIDLYKIPEVKTMYRGTLRNISHCESWNYFKKLGLFDRERIFDFRKESPAEVLSGLLHIKETDLANGIAQFLKIPSYSLSIKKMEWIGLFSEQTLPLTKGTAFDMFAYLLQTRLVYRKGERDLLVQHHEFIAEYGDASREKITSTMVDLGIPNGDSSMSRTVSLPVAIATKHILNGTIRLSGVHIPVLPEIYNPVLNDLKAMNIELIEVRQKLA